MISKTAILFLGILALFFAACATTQPPVSAQTTTVVQPGQSQQDCSELAKGDVLNYTFTASVPVDFNVNYHSADKVIYPVQKTNLTSDTGSFTADEKAEYCLTWTNHGTEQANVTYTSHPATK